MPLQYTYLTGALISLILWIIIYVLKSDLRKPMLKASIFLGGYGVLFEYLWWTHDWWRPQTITGTRVGLEDFLTAFAVGGIICAIFPILSGAKTIKNKTAKIASKAIYLILAQMILVWLLSSIFGMTSFYATIISYIVTSAALLFWHVELVINALVTALATLAGSIPIFLALIYFSPQFVSQSWHMANLSGNFILEIPFEDLVFFFLLGLFFGPFFKKYL